MKQLTDFSDSSYFGIGLTLLLLIFGGLAFRVIEFYQEWKKEQDRLIRLKQDQFFKLLCVRLLDIQEKYPCINAAYQHEYEENIWQIMKEDIVRDEKLQAFSVKERLRFIKEFRNAYTYGMGQIRNSNSGLKIAHSNLHHF